ncbi:TetR/AcrR family transcriptional regulator [Sneathiella glossodoripedis]|uniref:TetR/AcrR family transcriptional regulator n=1 Tax=Sneathiella glossodoripedis TaxID=418853 RepID=UPI000B19E1A7|nr:TetR/AcrR family transcriptional regulator [Sneathiella glossodoripedis]
MVTDNEIIEAVIYVFAHKSDATMDDVAKEAKISRITLNRKFGSKEKMIERAELYSIQQFDKILKKAKASRKSSMDKFLMVLKEYYRFRNHYTFWMRTIVDDPEGNQKLFLKQLEIIESLVRDAQEQGHIRQDLPAGWVASLFDFLIIAANSSRMRGIIAERDLIKIVWETFQYGISPRRAF